MRHTEGEVVVMRLYYKGRMLSKGLGDTISLSSKSYCPRYGQLKSYSRCNAFCMQVDRCEALYSASVAPLCSLPQYMVSRYPDVRLRANARFDELRSNHS